MKEFKFIHGLYTDDSPLDEDDRNECLAAYYSDGSSFELSSKNTKDTQDSIIKNNNILYTVRPEQLIISGTVSSSNNSFAISGFDSSSVELPKDVVKSVKNLQLSADDFSYSDIAINIGSDTSETSPVKFTCNEKSFIRDMIFKVTGSVKKYTYSKANNEITTYSNLYTVNDDYEFTKCNSGGVFYEGQKYSELTNTGTKTCAVNPSSISKITLAKKYTITGGYFVNTKIETKTSVSYDSISDYSIYSAITTAYTPSSKRNALEATDKNEVCYTLDEDKSILSEGYDYPCYYTTSEWTGFGLYNNNEFFSGEKTSLYYKDSITDFSDSIYYTDTDTVYELTKNSFNYIDNNIYKCQVTDSITLYWCSTSSILTSIDGKTFTNSQSITRNQIFSLTLDDDNYNINLIDVYIKCNSDTSANFYYYKESNSFYQVSFLTKCSNYSLKSGFYYATESTVFDSDSYIKNSTYSNAAMITESDDYTYNENQDDSNFYEKVTASDDERYIALKYEGKFPAFNYKYLNDGVLTDITIDQINSSSFKFYSQDVSDTDTYVVVDLGSMKTEEISSSNVKLNDSNDLVAINDSNAYKQLYDYSITATS